MSWGITGQLLADADRRKRAEDAKNKTEKPAEEPKPDYAAIGRDLSAKRAAIQAEINRLEHKVLHDRYATLRREERTAELLDDIRRLERRAAKRRGRGGA